MLPPTLIYLSRWSVNFYLAIALASQSLDSWYSRLARFIPKPASAGDRLALIAEYSRQLLVQTSKFNVIITQ
ncbi:hypothetical protein [Gloeocapsa sp. PCC 7428]|uniref:hypothetical protein n=1 Tax=Gloeocapsa sp. PCC 7428 TaxID=1173026 RepID=UPI0012DEC392|nr:hypothetical protein [Gloeocapsa sp. PCC 7428]